MHPSSVFKNTPDHAVGRIITCVICAVIGTLTMIFGDQDYPGNVLFDVGILIVVVSVTVFMFSGDIYIVLRELFKYSFIV